MPKPVACISCNSTQSLLWRPCEDGQICHQCYLIDSTNANTAPEKVEGESQDTEESQTDQTPVTSSAPKSTKKTGNRWTRPRSGAAATNSNTGGGQHKGSATVRGRGRRSLFKRAPFKAPSGSATVVTSNSVYYNGIYIQVGDIVSMMGTDDSTYYAQIRGFMTDQYCEKSAVLTWLLPTKASPPPELRFDPATYIIGPEEDLPRKLECMEFIMHAPSDYYKAASNPYPPIVAEAISKNSNGFIWTSLEAKDR